VVALPAAEPEPTHAVSAGLRLVAVAGAILLAYSFSLSSLLEGWRYETPLAHLALVPVLAAVLLFAVPRRYPHVQWLRLGRFDGVVAAVCLVVALAILALGPAIWSTYFWASRLDLLTLPFFAAAAVVLLFGARSLTSFVFPLAFLLLAWPLPYLIFVEQTLAMFTQATALGVEAVVVPSGLAAADPTAGGGAFVVTHAGTPFTVAVASACSGVNAIVGFFVVAAFALYFVRGPILRRLAWLATGALLVWLFNVLRIVAILGTGSLFGERAAFRVLHPVSGLVALNVAALLCVLLMRPYGLRWRRDPVDVDSPLAEPAAPAQRARPPVVARRVVALLAVALLFALAGGPLQAASRGFSNDGRPAVTAYVRDPVQPLGWSVRRLEQVRFATPYYGKHSLWWRYRLRPLPGDPRPFTIWLDAVTSPDLGALNAYTLAHCYAFHGFHVDLAQRLDLGAGVVGQAFVYATRDALWHAVSWQWPVVLGDGRVEHERIVLLASSPIDRDTSRGGGSGRIFEAVLSLLNMRSPNQDDNPALTAAMREVAQAVVAERVRAGA
jgi:exosortase/archaeosortase family protein